MKICRTVLARFLPFCGAGWLFALLVALSGCVYLPIPVPSSDTGYARTNVTQVTSQQFALNKTGKADVILALGEPDAVSADELKLVYRSETIEACWFVAFVFPIPPGAISGTTGDFRRERYYVFELDSSDHLLVVTQKTEWVVPENGRPYLVEFRLDSATNSLPPSLAGERLCRHYANAFWLPDLNGYKDGVLKYEPGIPGQLFLTDANIAFFRNSDLLNGEPGLKVPLARVNSVRVDKSWTRFLTPGLVPQLLVIHSVQYQSFSFLENAEARSAFEFIQTQRHAPSP